MGRAKEEWMASQERGWDAPEKHLCDECVEDEFLKKFIQDHAEVCVCDYCGRSLEVVVGAPVESILNPIATAFFRHFADPTDAGVPRDSGDWIIEFTDTADALKSLALECHEGLFDDVVGAFHNDAWVACANGHWLGEHQSTTWTWSWQSFERIVKTRRRYFFAGGSTSAHVTDEQETRPAELLTRIGRMAEELNLFRYLDVGTQLYRVRKMHDEQVYKSFDDLGPPPTQKAGAGRMNPAGISYLYLAKERSTAVGEVLKRPPARASVATFSLLRKMLMLDLSALPVVPSIFDIDRYAVRETVLFLNHFVDAISRPVAKDGREHVDYVPSQVVSEFFAQVFKGQAVGRIDGMVYPSAVVNGGLNVVLFPPQELSEQWNRLVELNGVDQITVDDWNGLLSLVSG